MMIHLFRQAVAEAPSPWLVLRLRKPGRSPRRSPRHAPGRIAGPADHRERADRLARRAGDGPWARRVCRGVGPDRRPGDAGEVRRRGSLLRRVRAGQAAGGQASRASRHCPSLGDRSMGKRVGLGARRGLRRRHPRAWPAQDRGQSASLRDAQRPGRSWRQRRPGPPDRAAGAPGRDRRPGGEPGTRPGQHAPAEKSPDTAGRADPHRGDRCRHGGPGLG